MCSKSLETLSLSSSTIWLFTNRCSQFFWFSNLILSLKLDILEFNDSDAKDVLEWLKLVKQLFWLMLLFFDMFLAFFIVFNLSFDDLIFLFFFIWVFLVNFFLIIGLVLDPLFVVFLFYN